MPAPFGVTIRAASDHHDTDCRADRNRAAQPADIADLLHADVPQQRWNPETDRIEPHEHAEIDRREQIDPRVAQHIGEPRGRRVARAALLSIRVERGGDVGLFRVAQPFGVHWAIVQIEHRHYAE